MIYLDANIFLYALLNDDEKGESCRSLLIKVAKEEDACTSLLTWDECVYILKKKKSKEIAVSEGERLLIFPHLQFVHVDKIIIAKAQQIMKSYNLEPRDAIHAASALNIHVRKIVSDDPDFDNIPELKRIKPNEHLK